MQPVSNYLNVPFKLQKDSDYNPSPEALGFDPIRNYKYQAQNPADAEKVKNIIQELIASRKPYFFVDDKNPIVGIQKPNSQIIWKAVDNMTGLDTLPIVHEVARRRPINIHINSGSHGDSRGNTAVERRECGDGQLIVADVLKFAADAKVSLAFINEEHVPLYPDQAEHVIDAWCWSIKSHYTSLYHTEYKLDDNGEPTPPELRCVFSNTILRNPYYFEKCKKLNGRIHYYDRSAIEALKDQMLFNGKAIKCRVQECGSSIFGEESPPLPKNSLMVRIEEFHLSRIERKMKDREIVQLKDETQRKTERITVLETEVVQKDGEIHELTGRVTDLTLENTQAIKERDQAEESKRVVIDRVKSQSQEIDKLKEEREKIKNNPRFKDILAEILGEEFIEPEPPKPTIKEFITGRAEGYKYTKQEWRLKLSSQKKDAEFYLGCLFKGFTRLERHNAFVSQGFLPEQDIKHRELFEKFLLLKKEDIQLLVREGMNAYNGMFDYKKINFSNQEHESFLLPLMERLVEEKYVSEKALEKAFEHQVSIEPKLNEAEWSENEPNRWFPKTYEETLKLILAYALRIELCDQLLVANVGRAS